MKICDSFREAGNLWMRVCIPEIFQGHGRRNWMSSLGYRRFGVGYGYGGVGRTLGGTAKDKVVVQIVEAEVQVF